MNAATLKPPGYQIWWTTPEGQAIETLGQFVLYWLTRTDPIPEGEREIAHALGQRRFDYFIDQVVRKVRRSGGIGSQFGLSAAVGSAGRGAAHTDDKDGVPV